MICFLNATNGTVRSVISFNKPFSVNAECIGVDDGDQVNATDRMYGACIVATLRALQQAGQLNDETIPDLEYHLKFMASWGSIMQDYGCDDSCYDKVIKGYGVRLFGNRTDEERDRLRAAQKLAFVKYVKSLSEAEKSSKVATYELPEEEPEKPSEKDKSKGDDGDEDEDDEDEGEDDSDYDSDGDEEEQRKKNKKKVWFKGASEKDADIDDPSLKLTPAWKQYKP